MPKLQKTLPKGIGDVFQGSPIRASPIVYGDVFS